MSRLHLIRHGPTHARAMVGWSDLPADLGDFAALERLSAHLPAAAVVVSSDLVRAVATADAIQGSRRRLAHRPDLREIGFSAWELRDLREIETEDPELARAYWRSPGDIRAPGGESWNQMRARTDAAIDALIAEHEGGDIVIVAHLGVILSQIQRALVLSAAAVISRPIDNLSLTRITRLDRGWRVEAINHLP